MFDIWGFLLQTLTVSGVAALLLVVKALFKDKLSPKWQFAVWGVLGLIMLIPLGIGGRYTLFHWQVIVELIKLWVGDLSVTKVLFPFPVVTSLPHTVSEWLFAAYVLGVFAFVIKYIVSYVKLRRFVRAGKELSEDKLNYIKALAAEQKIKLCKVVAIDEVPCAFLCGVFRPVLVLPTESEYDEKIILHELFH